RGIATPPAGARNDKRAGTSPTRTARYTAPTRRLRRSVPKQSLYFVGAKHPETAEPVNQHISCRMLRPYAPTRTASVNAHRVGGQGQALPLRADRGILCRGNNMGRVGFRDW
ncbi:MAG TPA: hypothetical protein PKN11_10545, partial [Anaerolineaceae bacterium]|nr:hypothetical protein [Anaerolineaceae bacterium]